MKSSACRHDVHALCHPTGKVRLASGKTIRCSCNCHPLPEEQPKRPQKEKNDG